MQDMGTDHMLAPIRRLRAELSSLFTTSQTRESVHTVNKCANDHCPAKQITDTFLVKQSKFGLPVQGSKRTFLTRSESSSLATSQTKKHSFSHKDIEAASQVQNFKNKQKSAVRPKISLPLKSPPHLLPPPPRQLSRRHSDMTAIRRPEESWPRRPRNSFLSSDTAGDEHEENNEVARTMWRKQMQRRRTVSSFRQRGPSLTQEDIISLSNDSVEDHIYEEIAELDSDNDDTESESEDDSFLTLISLGRRNNLRYYGCTGWDFGTEVI
eukprot:GFUD01042419.1.p1 GENE.GFUD01042419.1~~GFUD01042419.1.p1  ORF type:complete len:268 (+),score=88.82 GFUD01042419.1:84-887(+)